MTSGVVLSVQNLSVSIADKVVVDDFSLMMQAGSLHVLMGPNGSGKSSCSLALMGHPLYTITAGSITFLGTDVTTLRADQRARLGMFLAFQYPYEVEGLVFRDFLRQAYNARYAGTEKQIGVRDFAKLLDEKMELLNIEKSFVDRHLNVGFSGGEKKRAEMLQLAVLQPTLAILDEVDSGLDVDALRVVMSCLKALRQAAPAMAILVITHYQHVVQQLEATAVHVMQRGRIIKSGDASLAGTVEREGYSGKE